MGSGELCHLAPSSEDPLNWISLCSSCLSICGTCWIIRVYLAHGKAGAGALIALLALSDLLTAIATALNSSVHLFELRLYDGWWCVGNRVLFQVGAQSAGFWTSIIALYYYSRVHRKPSEKPFVSGAFGKTQPSPLAWSLFTFLAFGLPVGLAALEVGMDWIVFSAQLGYCNIVDGWQELALWWIPLGLVFLFNCALYLLLIREMRKNLSSWASLFFGFRNLAVPFYFRVSLYILIYVLVWTPTLANYIIIESGSCAYLPTTYLYSILLNSIGFFDAVAYGFTNRAVRQLYRSRRLVLLLTFLFSPLLLPLFPLTYCLRRHLRQREESMALKNSIS